jgi:hypothetical protein
VNYDDAFKAFTSLFNHKMSDAEMREFLISMRLEAIRSEVSTSLQRWPCCARQWARTLPSTVADLLRQSRAVRICSNLWVYVLILTSSRVQNC